jgi:hypothetical protein
MVLNASKKVLFALFLSSFFLFIWASQRGRPESDLNARLTTTLQKFAKENGLKDEEMTSLLGGIVLNRYGWRQGGVGLIDNKETYILLDHRRNSLQIGGKEWEGKDSKDWELVLLDETHVIGSLSSNDTQNLRLVIFYPEEARFIDLSHNTGGRFRRFTR